MTGPRERPTVEETVALASAALGRPLGSPADLGGSSRSQVLRCTVDGGSAGTVVVKRFLDGGDGFVRESLGLSVLDGTPELLAQDAEHRLLVMADLGDLPTLADLLLGDDRDAAWSGARSWARALGTMAGRSRAGDARERLGAGDTEQWDATAELRVAADRLLELVPDAGRPAVDAELRAARTVLEVRDPAVVTPADTCPDNAVLGRDGWLFLDLEGTDVQHPALVAAYAALPFATCWCVFDPPPDLTDTMVAEFSAGLAVHRPDVVGEPGWTRDVTRACAVYVLLATGWLLDGALAGRPHAGPPGRSPSYRQLVSSRWRWAALHLRAELPALAEAFRLASRWAQDVWGADAETTGYPAFSGRPAGS